MFVIVVVILPLIVFLLLAACSLCFNTGYKEGHTGS